MNTYMLTQFDVLTALHREHYRTQGRTQPAFATAIFMGYCKAKLQKGRSKQEVSWKLADLEAQLPYLATSFIETRRNLNLPEGMYRLSRTTTAGASTSSTSGSNNRSSGASYNNSGPTSQWDASDLSRAGIGRRNSSALTPGPAFGRRTSNATGPSSSSTAASRVNGVAVNRPAATAGTAAAATGPVPVEGEELPPPPYAREDPEPDQTRQLEIRLAGERSRGQVDLPDPVAAAGLDGTEAREGTGQADGAIGLGSVVAAGPSTHGGDLTPEQREERDLEEAIRLSLAADAAQAAAAQNSSSTTAGPAQPALATSGALPPALSPASPPPDFASNPSAPTTAPGESANPPAHPPRPTTGPFAYRRTTSDFPPMRTVSQSSAAGDPQSRQQHSPHDLLDSTTEEMGQMSMTGGYSGSAPGLAPMVPMQTGAPTGSTSHSTPNPLQRQDTASKNPFLQPQRTGQSAAAVQSTPFGSPIGNTQAGTSHTTYMVPSDSQPGHSSSAVVGDPKRYSGGQPQSPIKPSSPAAARALPQTPFGAPSLPSRKSYAPPPGPPPTQAHPPSPLRSASINSTSSNPHAENLIRRVSSSSHHASGEDPLSVLSRYDTVILVDDSGSMAGGRWRETRAALMDVAELARRYDQDGVDVSFLNSDVKGMGLTSAEDIERIFASVKPGGSTPLGFAIEGILLDYMSQLESTQALAARGELPRGEGTKPMNLIVITDGAPTDDPESVLVNIARRVGVQLVQIGNEPEAREFLQELDDHLGEKHGVRDFIDTVPYHGEAMSADLIVKTLLGAINRRIDRRDN